MKNTFPLLADAEKKSCPAFNETHAKPRGIKAGFKMVIAIFSLMLVLAFSQQSTAATLVSDSADYGPGEEAILSGSGFQPGETVTVQVVHADGSVDTSGDDDHLPWNVVADDNGDFVTSWHVCEDDCVGASLIATADGQSSGLHAETTFTDAGILSSLVVGPQVGILCEATPGSVTYIVTVTRQAFINTASGGSTRAPLTATVGVNFCLVGAGPTVSGVFSPSTLTFLSNVTVQTCTLTLSITSLTAGSRNFGVQAYVSSISAPATIDVSTCTSGPNRIINTGTLNVSNRPAGSAVVTDALCNGDNGTIDLTIDEGASPFGVAWSNGATTEDISAPAGTYTFTVTDANGCSISTFETIEEPTVLEATATATDAVCNGSNGSIDATTTGGTTPYGFSWSNGATTEDISDVAGTYTLTVTDANGCSATASATISQPSAITVDAGADEETYFGFSGDQTVTHTINASGGTGTLSYSYTLLSYELIGGVVTTGNARPLICNSITLTGDEKFYSNSGLCSDNSCPGSGPNTSLVSPVCGGAGANKITLSLLDSAIVVVTVTDENGCSASDDFIMYSSDVRCFAGNSSIEKIKICHKTGSAKNPCVTMCIDSSALQAHLDHGDFVGPCPKTGCSARTEGETSNEKENGLLFIYPNPNSGLFHIEFSGASTPYQLTVTNVLGQIMYAESINDFSGAIDEQLDLGKLVEGSYYIQIRNDGNLYSQQIVISR